MRMFKYLVFPLLAILSVAAFGQVRQLAMIDLPGSPGFDAVVFSNGYLVMAHSAAGTVDVFDPVKRRLVAQVKGLANPVGLAVNESAGLVYVANTDASNLIVLSNKDWKVQSQVALSTEPGSLTFVPELSRLFVCDAHDESLSVVDVSNANRVSTVALEGRAEDVVFAPSRGVLLVSLQDRNQVIALDPLSMRVVRRMPLAASQPTHMALDPGNGRLYVAVRYAVLALNPDTGAELGRVPTPAGTDMLWLDEASGHLYAAASGGTMSVIKVGGGQFVAENEVKTEVRGHTLAFDPASKLIFMPGGREGRSKLLILKNLGAPANFLPAQAEAKMGH